MQGHEEILVQLCEIVKPFVKDRGDLGKDTDLVADLGLDSLQVMNLLVEVEDSFDISIPLNVLSDVRTIGDFVLQLQKLTREGA